MKEHLQPDRMETWFLFLQVQTRIVEQLTADLEQKHRLPLSWYDVLVQLHAVPGCRLRIQELGSRLALSASGLSRRIARMEEFGFVRRSPCPDDKRGVFVTLTSAGEEQLLRAAPDHIAGIERLFMRFLTDEDNAVMNHVLKKMLTES